MGNSRSAKETILIKVLSFDLALKTLIVLPCALILFHICNILGLVPVNIVWTGRITSDSKMQVMGMVSILLNAIILLCALAKARYIKNEYFQLLVEKMLPFVFWWLVGNSVVNLFSKSKIEAVVFTPILVILTICCYRIMREQVNTID